MIRPAPTDEPSFCIYLRTFPKDNAKVHVFLFDTRVTRVETAHARAILLLSPSLSLPLFAFRSLPLCLCLSPIMHASLFLLFSRSHLRDSLALLHAHTQQMQDVANFLSFSPSPDRWQRREGPMIIHHHSSIIIIAAGGRRKAESEWIRRKTDGTADERPTERPTWRRRGADDMVAPRRPTNADGRDTTILTRISSMMMKRKKKGNDDMMRWWSIPSVFRQYCVNIPSDFRRPPVGFSSAARRRLPSAKRRRRAADDRPTLSDVRPTTRCPTRVGDGARYARATRVRPALT